MDSPNSMASDIQRMREALHLIASTTTDAGAREEARAALSTPIEGGELPALPVAISDDELEALRRFHETSEDGEDYDVPKEMMQRLALIGLVRRTSGSRYEFTNFGSSVVNGDFARPTPAAAAIPTEVGIAWQAGAWPVEKKAVTVDGRTWYRDDHEKVAAAAAGVPPGMVLVPREPTPAMLEAMKRATWEGDAAMYRAALAASGAPAGAPTKGEQQP